MGGALKKTIFDYFSPQDGSVICGEGNLVMKTRLRKPLSHNLRKLQQ